MIIGFLTFLSCFRSWVANTQLKGGPEPYPEGSFSDRSVSFLKYSSTKTNPIASSYLVYFVSWMKCAQKCQKIAGC